jgi:rhodanese-related sulfurtransferase
MREDDISVIELKKQLDAHLPITILDVREQSEYNICNIGGLLIPLRLLPLRINELDPADRIAVICHHGNRSRVAVDLLKSRGFQNVVNVAGGLEEWALRVDQGMARY